MDGATNTVPLAVILIGMAVNVWRLACVEVCAPANPSVFVAAGVRVIEILGEGVELAFRGEPIKANPITKATNKIPPMNRNTSKITASPETPSGGISLGLKEFFIGAFWVVPVLSQF